ncbi:MAG: DUF4118 domain-containing protein [Acidobacteria bacterium]|nr:DUF4118 domain-containing protein [Acidobacteriota bacterium]
MEPIQRLIRNGNPETMMIVVVVVLITGLHFLTSTKYLLLHEIFQRLYYVPIIYAAYRYGVRGGLATSIFSSLIYLPHIFQHWDHYEIYMLNQLAEVLLFQVVAVVTGILANAERVQRTRSEQAASERQQAYEELKQTVEQLMVAERMTTLAQLSLALVHEIRNPLGGIRGAAEALETVLPPTASSGEFLAIIQAEVTRLNRLVTEFLEFGRPRVPEKLPTPPKELIQSVIRLTKQHLKEHKVEVKTDLAPDLPQILIDSEQIKQVLINLILNALEAMPDGGELYLGAHLQHNELEIRIADTGHGVSEEIRERLFQPFVTTKAKGSGLGLAICGKLVTQNGGTISAENGSDRGTVLWLRFPI